MNIVNALEEFQSIQERMTIGVFILIILTSLIAALVASALYRFFYESRATGSQVHRAFPLLGIAITTLFVAIQTSIPLSLGLLGTLSIIRFRTPIKEPEEIGFIMLVIATSVCAATFNFQYITVLLAVSAFSLLLVRGARTWHFLRRDGVLVLTMDGKNAEGDFEDISIHMKDHVRKARIESTSSVDGVTSMQMSFSGLRVSAIQLQNELHKVDAVQSVNVFLDRPGGIR